MRKPSCLSTIVACLADARKRFFSRCFLTLARTASPFSPDGNTPGGGGGIKLRDKDQRIAWDVTNLMACVFFTYLGQPLTFQVRSNIKVTFPGFVFRQFVNSSIRQIVNSSIRQVIRDSFSSITFSLFEIERLF